MADSLSKGDGATESRNSIDGVERRPKDEVVVSQNSPDEADIVYPSGLKLILLMISVFIGMFLVSLVCFIGTLRMESFIDCTGQDRLIVSTAIPEITNEFNSAGDIGWYGTAYMITNCAFQLVFGRIYTCFRVKYVFLTSFVLFEVGSAICGAAPSSIALIIGRAIAGIGSGGVMAGVVRSNPSCDLLGTSLSILRLLNILLTKYIAGAYYCIRHSAP